MRALVAWCVGAMAALSGCFYKPSADDLTQAEVDSIAEKCGYPRDRLSFNQGWVTMIMPSEDDVAGNCVVQEIKKTGKKRLSLVGNELYTVEGK